MVLIRVLFCGFGVSSVIVNELGTSHLSLKPDLAEQASVCVHSKTVKLNIEPHSFRKSTRALVNKVA